MAGLGRCARHGGWPKRFLRRGRRGGMARCVADRTLRSDVTGGRPRAVVLAIVRRLPLRLRAVALFGGRNETDKRETRPPPVRAGDACFRTGCIRSGVWPDFSRRRGRRGDGGAACGVRLTGLFSRRCGDGASGMTAGPSVFCGAVLAIARCGSCWRKERNGQTGNAPPARTGGGRVFWDGVHPVGCLAGLFAAARPAGRWVAARGQQEYFAAGTGAVWLPYGARFGGLRSPAAWRGRAVDPNLGAAGRRGDGGAARRRATNRTIFAAGRGGAPGMAAGPSVFCGAADRAMVRGVRCATNRTIFVAGRGGAPGMAAGPSVFCGAAGGAAWRVVWLTGLCAAM